MSRKPRVIKNAPQPQEVKMGRPRLYQFDKLNVGDAMDCHATYSTVHCSLRRYKKANEGVDFVINVIRRDADDPLTRVTRRK